MHLQLSCVNLAEKNSPAPWGCACTQCTPWLRLRTGRSDQPLQSTLIGLMMSCCTAVNANDARLTAAAAARQHGSATASRRSEQHSGSTAAGGRRRTAVLR